MPNILSDITYIVRQKEKPHYESSALTGMVPKLHFKTETRKVLIKDIRDSKNFSLIKNGFLFKKIKFNLEEKDIQNNYIQYKRDLSKFIKELFPYKYIDIFDITRRSNEKTGASNKDGPRQPAERAHVDYTNSSGLVRAKQILKNKFSEFRKYRVIQLNVWRPLCSKVLSSPLAIADASSISQKDLIETDQIFPDRIGEIYHLAYEKKQKWYWVSEMRNYEALIFKGWDSNTSNKVVKFTPHTSFNIPDQKINEHPRQSIEARIFIVL
ncbi:MAG: methyltransferase [Alphaproteobacteria bacterium]|nr:MAG: methyltransferase [Alphaproteobacteria bacterium]